MSYFRTTALTPSRYSNPFGTCWTRPGAIPFQFSSGQTAEDLVASLAGYGWRGAIVGPHGSGKSTLLATLVPLLKERGHSIVYVQSAATVCSALRSSATRASIVVVDGFEQLAWLARWRLTWVCRRRHAGLLVTAHRSIALPTLIKITPSLGVVEELVAHLCCSSQVATYISSADVADSFARHGSNVRELLFDLYDRHERRARTVANAPTGWCVAPGVASGQHTAESG